MKNLSLIFFLSLFFSTLSAQEFNVVEDEPIGKLMDKYIHINKNTTAVEGWRIQILATTDRQRMENAKRTFLNRYPNIPLDWIHSTPYYKLRAGAFSSKLEAYRLLHILKPDYPSAYPAKDKNIRPEELVGLQ